MTSRRWTLAISYATQAAQLVKLGMPEDAHRILKAFRAYQNQFEQNTIQWWLCTEAFEDEWRYQFPLNGPIVWTVDALS